MPSAVNLGWMLVSPVGQSRCRAGRRSRRQPSARLPGVGVRLAAAALDDESSAYGTGGPVERGERAQVHLIACRQKAPYAPADADSQAFLRTGGDREAG